MKVFLLILTLLVVSCGTLQNKMMQEIFSSWEGSHIDEVIERWGYPDAERVVAGRQIYIWDYREDVMMPSFSSSTSSSSFMTTGGGVLRTLCRRTLEVDEQNRVIRWQHSGGNCPLDDLIRPYKFWKK